MLSCHRALGIGIAGRSAGHLKHRWRKSMAVAAPRGGLSVVPGDLATDALHFSFAGTGTQYFAWMMGFCSELQSSGLLSANSTFFGVSGGASLAALLAAGVDMSEDSQLFEAMLANNDKLRRKEINIKQMVRSNLLSVLTEESVAHVSGKVHIAAIVGHGFYFDWVQRVAEPTLFSTFSDLEDLVTALLASTHIPYIVDGNKSTTFRGEEYMDYGLWGQSFLPVDGAISVNSMPHRSWDGPMPGASWLSRWLVSKMAAGTNKADAPVDVHPWLAADWWSCSRIFCWDDWMFRPLPREFQVKRHRLGRAAFHAWNDALSRERAASPHS